MAKGDDCRNKLTIHLNTQCVVTTSDGQERTSDASGLVEFEFNKELSLIGFTATPLSPDFQITHFEYDFTHDLYVTCPPVVPPDPPVDDNHLDEAIDNRYAAIDSDLFEDAILIQNRTIVYKWGNPDADQDNFASVCRVFANLIWGDWIKDNGFDWLDRVVNELGTSTSQTVDGDMKLGNLLSYTTPDIWIYSGGDDDDDLPRWPKQFAIIQELYGKPANEVAQEKIFNYLTGLRAWMISDGTMRVGGSVRNLFKFARLMFNRGKWNGHQIISEEYTDRTLAGGPWGTGTPFDLEGYQTHLIKHGSAWEMENELDGVPDGFMARSSKSYIIGIPSIGLIMAGKGPEQFQDVFLPQVVDIMMNRSMRALKAPRVFRSLVNVD